jgi:hypothetical protein
MASPTVVVDLLAVHHVVASFCQLQQLVLSIGFPSCRLIARAGRPGERDVGCGRAVTVKTNKLTRGVEGLALVALVTAILCTGWTTAPSYAGSDTPQQRAVTWYSEPDLPGDQIAVLDLGGSFSQVFTKDAVWVGNVDGKPIQFSRTLLHGYGPPNSIKLLPGRHSITFAPHAIGVSGTPIHKDVYVEAGKTYRVKLVASGMHVVFEQHLGPNPYTQSQGQWSVEITEE